MLDNFIFSLSVALPIFLIMLSGFILKTKNIIKKDFITAANFIVFYIALPLKLFNNVSRSSVVDNFNFELISFAIMGTIISVALIYIYSKFVVEEKNKLGAFIHGTFRGNFVYVGFSLLENVTGAVGPLASLVVAFVVPIYNVLAVLVLILTNSNNKAKNQFKDALKNIIKNPFIIAIGLGIIASLINFKMTPLMQNTANYFDVLATPLALLTIGATFRVDKLFIDIKPAAASAIFKLIINPLLAVMAALLLDFSNSEIFLIYILFGVPTSISSAIITAAMGGDENLAASIVMLTTLGSVFSLTLFVFVFKLIKII
ncbi:predicted Permease [Halanaerobium saccharolyticum subsp. saccharolyticum DSM 6643]|uniref:Predicted Permease n=1 Tax=Halanaerobium saccharolyticum subsp. saccharolyticum DSM 6643 TaxID=1293054 RepID=M5E407_9FIRM|nr:AEC family transporter [Halanaerobium saccharolyticum]CCU81084.1 predicted Permease [Halanaerobium saccharolyticum subsp. saccharolyticum DSM 6643]